MAITGDIGEIERYEKDLMLRTTGTTDPGLATIKLREALDPKNMKERVTSLATVYKHISNYVNGATGELPAAEILGERGILLSIISLPFKGGTGVNNAEEIRSLLNKAGRYVATKYWNTSGGSTMMGDPGMSSGKVKDTENNDANDIINKGEGERSPAEITESGGGLSSPVFATAERGLFWQDEGQDLNENSLPIATEERQPTYGKSENSWSFFGMVVNGIKGVASAIRSAVIGGSQDTSGDQISEARSLDGGNDAENFTDIVKNVDIKVSTTHTPDSLPQVNEEYKQTAITKDPPDDSIPHTSYSVENALITQISTAENDTRAASARDREDLIVSSNTDPVIAEISGSGKKRAEALDHEEVHNTERVRNPIDGENIGNDITSNLDDKTLEPASDSGGDTTSGVYGTEGVKSYKISTPTKSKVIPIHQEQETPPNTENSETGRSMGGADDTEGAKEEAVAGLSIKDMKEAKTPRTEANHNGIDHKTAGQLKNNTAEEPTKADRVPGNDNSGARLLGSELTNKTSSEGEETTEPSNSLFGRIIQYVGHMANKAVSAVTGAAASGDANYAGNVTRSVSEGNRPEGGGFLENSERNKTASDRTNATRVAEEVDNKPTSRGPPSIITEALETEEPTSDITNITSVRSNITEHATSIGNEEPLKQQQALKQVTAEENTLTRFEEQLVKPGTVDQVTPEFDSSSTNGIVLGTRSLLDEVIDHATGTASSIHSNGVPSTAKMDLPRDAVADGGNNGTAKDSGNKKLHLKEEISSHEPLSVSGGVGSELLSTQVHVTSSTHIPDHVDIKIKNSSSTYLETSKGSKIIKDQHGSPEDNITSHPNKHNIKDMIGNHVNYNGTSSNSGSTAGTEHNETINTSENATSIVQITDDDKSNAVDVTQAHSSTITAQKPLSGDVDEVEGLAENDTGALANKHKPEDNDDKVTTIRSHIRPHEPSFTADVGGDLPINPPDSIINGGNKHIVTPSGDATHGLATTSTLSQTHSHPTVENYVPNPSEAIDTSARVNEIKNTHVLTDFNTGITTSTANKPAHLGTDVDSAAEVNEINPAESIHIQSRGEGNTLPSILGLKSTSPTSPQPSAMGGTTDNVDFNASDTPMSGAHELNLQSGQGSALQSNDTAQQAPPNGFDIFGKLAHIVGKVVNTTTAAVKKTIPPENVKFMEDLANNITTAVVESIAPEDKVFVQNKASNISPVVDEVNAHIAPPQASVPPGDMANDARGQEADLPKKTDPRAATPKISGGSEVHNNPGSRMSADGKKPAVPSALVTQLHPQALNPKTEGQSLPTDGGWIFVNVVNAKPQILQSGR